MDIIFSKPSSVRATTKQGNKRHATALQRKNNAGRCCMKLSTLLYFNCILLPRVLTDFLIKIMQVLWVCLQFVIMVFLIILTIWTVFSNFAIILKRERVCCFASVVLRKSCYCKCSVTLTHDAMGWSAVCDCGISWSYSFTSLWLFITVVWFWYFLVILFLFVWCLI